jgi:hypothetical protein
MMSAVKKYVLVSIVIVCLGALGVASLLLLKDRQTTNAPVLQEVSIRLNWVPQAQFAGIYVAREKGYYHDVGLSVEIRGYEQDLDQTREVADGKSDFGISTGSEVIVARAKGLQVKTVDNHWIAVNQPPESIVVIPGDMLELYTKGAIKPTPRRVVNPANGTPNCARYAYAFFVHPRPEVILTTNPPTTAGEFLRDRLQEIGHTSH